MLEIHLDALLVAVQAHEVRGLAARQRRAPRARDVAGTLGLELDHSRAEVGEHGGAEGAGEGVAQIDDGNVFERQAHELVSSTVGDARGYNTAAVPLLEDERSRATSTGTPRAPSSRWIPRACIAQDVYTDRCMGTIRVLTPVTRDGALDAARPVLYLGEARSSPRWGLPIAFEIEACPRARAAIAPAAAAEVGVERTMRQGFRRCARGRIVHRHSRPRAGHGRRGTWRVGWGWWPGPTRRRQDPVALACTVTLPSTGPGKMSLCRAIGRPKYLELRRLSASALLRSRSRRPPMYRNLVLALTMATALNKAPALAQVRTKGMSRPVVLVSPPKLVVAPNFSGQVRARGQTRNLFFHQGRSTARTRANG